MYFKRNKIIFIWVYTIKLETKMLEFDYAITYDKCRIPIIDKLKKKNQNSRKKEKKP